MGINLHERFENHMDMSSPEKIGDAEKITDFDTDNPYEDMFDKKISDAEKNIKIEQPIYKDTEKKLDIVDDGAKSIKYSMAVIPTSGFGYDRSDTALDRENNNLEKKGTFERLNTYSVYLDGEHYTRRPINQILQVYEKSCNEDNDVTDKIKYDNNIESIKTWIKEINPKFDPFDYDSPYSQNCGSCAYAVEQRLSGNITVQATAVNIDTSDEMNKITGMEQIFMRPEEIREKLISMGAGAHAIIGIDRGHGAGHWFNAFSPDGKKVFALDGQSGEVLEWPPDFGDVINWDMSIRKENQNA